MAEKLAIIVLAAGMGTRMKSQIPKVLHTICGRPLLSYTLDLAHSLKPTQIVVVLGYQKQSMQKHIPFGVKIALQKRLEGTADAVKVGLRTLKNFSGNILVLYGDVPLLKKESLRDLLLRHTKSEADATLLVAEVKDPKGYGRILRDKHHNICAVVEEKDADDFDKEINEINTGIMVFRSQILKESIGKIRRNKKKKEYYLTDIVHILYHKERVIESVKLKDYRQAMGINSRIDLAKANFIMQQRINEVFMRQGVTIIDPSSTFINYGTRIGKDTVIYPFTVIENNVKIGKLCSIGPFAHLREGTRIADEVVLGNFVELNRVSMGQKSLAKHFCYLGDAEIGRSVNIGAGVVTANFDGRNKHKTTIQDSSFIGSDTIMVAPVKIGRNSATGAGSVVLKDVGAKEVVVGVPAKKIKKRD